MTIETVVESIAHTAKRDIVSKVLLETAKQFCQIKHLCNLSEKPSLTLPQSVDTDYNDEYYVEVSVRLIKRII